MTRILIGISTYNEIENLPSLIEQIDRYLPDADVLVVDDNSPDGTGHWCEQQAAEREDFHAIRREGKLGLGTATLETFRFASAQRYDLLINMDADLSHPADRLPALVAAMDAAGTRYDVAIGSRYIDGGSIVGWPWRRKMMSRCVNWYARRALGLAVRDCSGAFRCYRVSTLNRLHLEGIRSRGYSFFEEILWCIRHAGGEFTEVPIQFQDREKGQSKINLREAFLAVRIIASLAFAHPPKPKPVSEPT